jgi:hypothetical protein
MPIEEPRLLLNPALSREDRREAIKAALAAMIEFAQLFDEVLESEEGSVLVNRVERVTGFPIDYPPLRSSMAFSTMMFASASAASQVRCDAPPLPPSICDLVLTQLNNPHYRCHHTPTAHCYDFGGMRMDPCP